MLKKGVKMRNKILFYILCIVLLLSFASCGQKPQQEEKITAQQSSNQGNPGTEAKKEEYKALPGAENWPSFRGRSPRSSMRALQL